jgi:hypothetical protein
MIIGLLSTLLLTPDVLVLGLLQGAPLLVICSWIVLSGRYREARSSSPEHSRADAELVSARTRTSL